MKEKEILKKLVCICLVVSMIISAVPANEVFAGEAKENIEEIASQEKISEEKLLDDISETGIEIEENLPDELSTIEDDDSLAISEIEEFIIKEEKNKNSNNENDLLSDNIEFVESDAEDLEYIDSIKSNKYEAFSSSQIKEIENSLWKMSGFYQGQTYRNKGKDQVGQCTYNTKQNLYRRRIYFEELTNPLLSKNNEWKKITHKQDKGNTIPHSVVNDSSHKLSYVEIKKGGIKKEELKKLLKEHPEGVSYFNYVGDTGHALLITRCDENGILYGVDPSDVRYKSVTSEMPLYKTHLFSSTKYKVNSSSNDEVWKNLETPPKGRSAQFRVAKCKNKGHESIVLCNHHYVCGLKDAMAYCDKTGCGQKYNHDSHKDDNFSAGKYLISSSLSLYSAPYSGAAKTGVSIKKNDVVNISKAVINAYGNIWGYTNKKGWICIKDENDSDYKYKIVTSSSSSTQVTPTVNFGTLNVPSNGHIGPYNLTNTIECKGAVIESVTGCILNASNQVVQKKTVNGNGTGTFKVSNSGITTGTDCLKFENLSAGKYKYKFTVKLSGIDKSQEKTSNEFTIGSVTKFEKPDIKQVESSVGKVIYQISKPGYVIEYSLNGVKYPSFNDSKKIELGANTTIRATTIGKIGSSSSAYAKSDEAVKAVTIEKVQTPEITTSQNANGTTVSIAVSGSYNVIYYKINNGNYNKYTGPFNVTADTVVSTYAANIGMITSDVSSKSIQVTKPDAPSIVLTSKSDIADGDAITVSWNNDSKVKSYTVNVKKNNEIWKTLTSNAAYCVFNAEGSGIYSISVVAHNNIGDSPSSNTVSCEVHDPVTVRFIEKDENNNITVIGTPQTVRYGCSAVAPVTPKKKGFTFEKWNGDYSNVTKDIDVVAVYQTNTYNIMFYDVDGQTYLGNQNVLFNQAVNEELYVEKVTIKNPGRNFAGWEIFNVKDTESKLDLKHADSDMSVRAVTTWTNQSMPCLVSNISAKEEHIDGKNGFTVSCTISSTDKKDLRAKVIVSLCTNRGNNVYRTVKTSTKECMLKADTSNRVENIDVSYEEAVKIDRILVSVVSIEGNDRTGGLIAAPKYYDVPMSTNKYYSYYTGWMTAEDAQKAGYSLTGSNVQTRTTYRSRNNTRTTTGWIKSSTAPSGYKLLNTVKRDGTWSSWSDTKYTATTLRDVETRQVDVSQGHTEYRYGCWTNGAHTIFCPKYGKTKWSGTWSKKYTSWSKTRTKAEMVGTAGNGNFCPYNVYKCTRSTDHIGKTSSHNNSSGQPCDYWQYKYHPSGTDDYYWEESKYVDTSYKKTQYRYKDNYYEYDYYKFDAGTWSSWSTTAVSEVHTTTKDVDVQSRKEYNILVEVVETVETTGAGMPKDTKGITRSISGTLNDASLAGKTALVLIYNEKNTDPTRSQLEYVGETKLDSDGGYNISFVTRDDPDDENVKSDFVVSLAIEGSDNCINVDLIRYKRNEYTVKFVDGDNVVKEVTVEEGKSVIAPEIVEKEGFDFVGWDGNTTEIKSDITIVAKYNPKEYCIAFVDYENRTCNLSRQKYGDSLTVPADMENPTFDGYEFDGWDIEDGITVSGDTVVVAKWIPQTFTVKFMDGYGNTINTQENIEYGKSVTLPNLNVPDNMEFLGWSEEEEWWNVTKDMDIYPIIVYKDKLAAPTSNMDFETEGEGHSLTLEAAEGAEIYYTIDGLEPSVEKYEMLTGESEDIITDSISETLNFNNIIEDNIALDANTYSVDMDYDDTEDDYVDTETGDFEESEDDRYGITYKYEGPILLDDDCVIRAIAVAPEYQESEIAEFYHSMEYTEPERGDLIEVYRQYVSLKSGEKIKLALDFNDVESLYSGELLINSGNAMVYPYYDDDENIGMKVSSDFSQLGDVDVNMVNEGGNVDFSWAGSEAISNPGRMFTVELCVDEETQSGYYPISILYAPKYTFDEKCEPVALEGKVSLVINPKEEIKPVKHSIIYVLDGGTNSLANPSEYTEGTEVVLKNPTKSGYIFAGWYNNASFTGSKVSIISATSKTDITLYARWEEESNEGLTFKAELSDIEYNGTAIKPDIEVYWDGNRLKLGTDYTLSYQNNTKAATENSSKAPTITITGKGDYAKSYKKTFTINQKDLSNCEYVDSINVQYNTKVTPVIACNGIQLKATDYDMYKVTDGRTSSIKATEKWTGDGVLRLVGKGNFKGTVDIDIYVTDEKPLMINATVSNEKLYFDGEGKIPSINVFDKVSKQPLTEYSDYVVIEPEDKINAGAHKFVIAGVGDYAGIIQKSYTINPVEKASGYMDVECLGDAIYNGRGSIPDDVTVKYHYGSYGCNYLGEGKDYTLKYSNNKKVGYGKITVSFIGNYKGRPVETKEYRIVSNSLYDAAVLIPDKTNCNDKGVFKQKPVISVGGVKLSASDYNVTYYVDDSYSKSAEMTSSNPIRIGSEGYATVWVRIEGVGNYKDTVETSYNVYKKLNKGSSIIDLSKATVSIKNASTIAFENKEIQPEIDRVTVGGRTIKSDYYTVSYAINVYKGTASVMVTGDGENVIGSKVATFAIKPYDVNNIKE